MPIRLKSLNPFSQYSPTRERNCDIYHEEKTFASRLSDESSAPMLQPFPEPPAAPLKIKKVDHYYSRWKQEWKYKNSNSDVMPEDIEPYSVINEEANAEWKDYCFVIVRELPRRKSKLPPYFKLVIRSPRLIAACERVMGDVQMFSTFSNGPLEVHRLRFR